MRFVLVAVLAWISSPCYGQVDAVEAGSPEADEQLRQYRQMLEEHEAEYQKALQVGHDLFGVDENWKEKEAVSDKPKSGTKVKQRNRKEKNSSFGGTIGRKDPKDFAVGDWGFYPRICTVIQRIGDQSILVNPLNENNEPAILHGLDCSKVVDGTRFVLQRPVVITRTHTYQSVSGAPRTVMFLECEHAQVSRLINLHKERMEQSLYRSWTQAIDQKKLTAKFLEFKDGKALLQKEDSSIVALQPGKLSEADRAYIREEVKRRRIDPEPKQFLIDLTNLQSEPLADNIKKPKSAKTNGDSVQWMNKSYDTIILRGKDDEWQEKDNKTGRVNLHYRETNRTTEYVELFCIERNYFIRLLPDKAQIKKNDDWEWVSNGHWVVSHKALPQK